jgi:hypothetical protein
MRSIGSFALRGSGEEMFMARKTGFVSPVAKAKKSNRAAPDCPSFILTSGR